MNNHVHTAATGGSAGTSRRSFHIRSAAVECVRLICFTLFAAGVSALIQGAPAQAGDRVVIPQVTQGYGDPPPPPPVVQGQVFIPPNPPAYGESPDLAPYPPSQPGGVVIPRVTEGYGAPPPHWQPEPGPGMGQGGAFDPGQVFGPGTVRQPPPPPRGDKTPPPHRSDKAPPPPAGPHLSAPFQVSGVTIIDINTGRTLPIHSVDLRPTFDRIQRGEKNAHRNDGTVYRNNNRQLPRERSGYYHEYVVPTPGVHGPGPQRLILGQRGEAYYTPDHYDTFVKVQ